MQPPRKQVPNQKETRPQQKKKRTSKKPRHTHTTTTTTTQTHTQTTDSGHERPGRREQGPDRDNETKTETGTEEQEQVQDNDEQEESGEQGGRRGEPEVVHHEGQHKGACHTQDGWGAYNREGFERRRKETSGNRSTNRSRGEEDKNADSGENKNKHNSQSGRRGLEVVHRQGQHKGTRHTGHGWGAYDQRGNRNSGHREQEKRKGRPEVVHHTGQHKGTRLTGNGEGAYNQNGHNSGNNRNSNASRGAYGKHKQKGHASENRTKAEAPVPAPTPPGTGTAPHGRDPHLSEDKGQEVKGQGDAHTVPDKPRSSRRDQREKTKTPAADTAPHGRDPHPSEDTGQEVKCQGDAHTVPSTPRSSKQDQRERTKTSRTWNRKRAHTNRGGWSRDLTQDGDVEANPGPRHHDNRGYGSQRYGSQQGYRQDHGHEYGYDPTSSNHPEGNWARQGKKGRTRQAYGRPEARERWYGEEEWYPKQEKGKGKGKGKEQKERPGRTRQDRKRAGEQIPGNEKDPWCERNVDWWSEPWEKEGGPKRDRKLTDEQEKHEKAAHAKHTEWILGEQELGKGENGTKRKEKRLWILGRETDRGYHNWLHRRTETEEDNKKTEECRKQREQDWERNSEGRTVLGEGDVRKDEPKSVRDARLAQEKEAREKERDEEENQRKREEEKEKNDREVAAMEKWTEREKYSNKTNEWWDQNERNAWEKEREDEAKRTAVAEARRKADEWLKEQVKGTGHEFEPDYEDEVLGENELDKFGQFSRRRKDSEVLERQQEYLEYYPEKAAEGWFHTEKWRHEWYRARVPKGLGAEHEEALVEVYPRGHAAYIKKKGKTWHAGPTKSELIKQVEIMDACNETEDRVIRKFNEQFDRTVDNKVQAALQQQQQQQQQLYQQMQEQIRVLQQKSQYNVQDGQSQSQPQEWDRQQTQQQVEQMERQRQQDAGEKEELKKRLEKQLGENKKLMTMVAQVTNEHIDYRTAVENEQLEKETVKSPLAPENGPTPTPTHEDTHKPETEPTTEPTLERRGSCKNHTERDPVDEPRQKRVQKAQEDDQNPGNRETADTQEKTREKDENTRTENEGRAPDGKRGRAENKSEEETRRQREKTEQRNTRGEKSQRPERSRERPEKKEEEEDPASPRRQRENLEQDARHTAHQEPTRQTPDPPTSEDKGQEVTGQGDTHTQNVDTTHETGAERNNKEQTRRKSTPGTGTAEENQTALRTEGTGSNKEEKRRRRQSKSRSRSRSQQRDAEEEPGEEEGERPKPRQEEDKESERGREHDQPQPQPQQQQPTQQPRRTSKRRQLVKKNQALESNTPIKRTGLREPKRLTRHNTFTSCASRDGTPERRSGAGEDCADSTDS